ncbi:MAG: hypothetical protein IPP71_15245 [Bacteroidetes bacterium]|nr:hypothetical protein [Bacteroidota bacterium]
MDSNAQVFNPNNTALDIDFTLSGADSIVAHFLSTSSLPEVPGMNPSVAVYPTVFDASSTVDFYLPETAPVTLKLYSLMGAEVMKIEMPQGKLLQPGKYEVELNM